MSTEQSIDPELVEQTKQQIKNLVREIAQISKSEIGPQEFYDAVLNRVVTALAAAGGAIWSVSDSGQLALEYQINLKETRLHTSEEDQVRHAKLLRKVVTSGEGLLMAPHSGAGDSDEGSNPTDFLLVLGPLKTAQDTAGVMEIFQRPGSPLTVQRGYLRFLLQMCELASEYLKSRKLRHFTDRQALWSQLEQFTRLVHSDLDLKNTAFTIVNEGRRLIECDRVSVAICRGRKTAIEAVSGQDIFDPRSNQVMLLTKLAKSVVSTGEAVWYTGDTSNMAPQVEEAVQDYVDEVHSKAVGIIPLKEPHDKTNPLAKAKVMGALIIEQIEDSRPRDGLTQRVEIVSEHSSIALHNVLEHHDLFLMPVWRTIGKSRWLVEARQLPWTVSIGSALLVILAFLCLWPADFKLTGNGTLQPAVQRKVFADIEGEIIDVLVKHGDTVTKGQKLAQMRNLDLDVKFETVQGELRSTWEQLDSVRNQLSDHGLKNSDQARLKGEAEKLIKEQESLQRQLQLLEVKREQLTVKSPIDGQIITWQLRETLIFRPVQPGNLLMTIVEPQGPWELEVKMPEDQMGFITAAQAEMGEKLPVTYMTNANPGPKHDGQVTEVHRSAEVRGEEGNTVLIRVAINKEDVPERRPGATVQARVNCGRAAIGYVWFHDLVAFVQKKIIFPFF